MKTHAFLLKGGVTLLAALLSTDQVRADDALPTVSVVAARSGELQDTISVVGSIVVREETLITVDLEGARIEQILAEEGDMVTRGQLLARLDSAKIAVELLRNDAQRKSADAQAGQAQSAIDTATVTRTEAAADLQRSLKLSSKGIVSSEALEQRRNALARAEASLGSARQALKVAEAVGLTASAERHDIALRLARTEILAPTAGRIMKRTAKVGSIASSSGEPLFVIANDGALELDAEIPQSQMARLTAGSVAAVSIQGGLPALAGRIRLLAPALAAGSRLGRARITLPQGIAVPAGAFARAEINVGSGLGLFLPATAIIDLQGNPQVQVIQGNRVEQKAVATGLALSGLVQIRSGIVAGDLVVLRAASFLTAGDAVTPYRISYEVARKTADVSILADSRP